jgi:hypothetical protein
MVRPKILDDAKSMMITLEQRQLDMINLRNLNISMAIRNALDSHLSDISILEIAEKQKIEIEKLKSELRDKENTIDLLALKAGKKEAVNLRIEEIADELMEIEINASKIKFDRVYEAWLQKKNAYKVYKKGSKEYKEHYKDLKTRMINLGLSEDDAGAAAKEQITAHNNNGFTIPEPIYEEPKLSKIRFIEKAKLKYEEENNVYE